MVVGENNLGLLLDALPGQFKFYDLGEVKIHSSTHSSNVSFSDHTAIAYRIHGDVSALLILIFDKGLDISLYAEVGNVIVSQLITKVSADQGADLMISAPKILTETQFRKFEIENSTNFRRSYAHFFKNSVIPLEALILPSPLEGSGYA